MRLRRLNILRYGHFADATLDFAGNGLQVIHGHNEAGKSTLLQFVRELLFGFGERNRFAFQGDKLEGGALLEFRDQPDCELRRRKGRPDSLQLRRGDQSQAILESDLQTLLGGANGPLYQNVFAFGLSELANGEESLRIEAVQHALHGSGVGGLTNPQKILDQLTKDAEALFKERGSRQEVAAICADLKKLTSELKEKVTKTEVYLQRKRDYDAARVDAEQLALQLAQLRRDFARDQKLSTAYPLWRELSDLQRRRQVLGASSLLGSESRQKFERTQEELKRTAKDIAKLERDLQHTESEMQKNPAQAEWLALRAQIEQARELIKSVQEARRDLPLLEAELQLCQQQVGQGVRDVISSWTIRDLEGFRCDAGQRAQCEQFVETQRALGHEQIRLEERSAALIKEQAENQADLAAIGPIADVTLLQALLNSHAAQVTREAELARLTKDEAKQQRTIATQLRKLSPPLPVGAAHIETIPVPPLDEIQRYQSQFTEARRRMNLAEQSLAEAEERCRQQSCELAAAQGSLREIPTQEGLQRLRDRRSTGWKLLRQRYIDGQPAIELESAWLENAGQLLPDEFERAMSAADGYADSMFGNAALVQQQEQVAVARRDVAARREELTAQQLALKDLESRWEALWASCGFVPFDPDTMSGWKTQHDHVLELLSKQADLLDELQRLRADSDAFGERLSAALPQFQGGADERLQAAQLQVAQAQQQAQELKTSQRQAARLEKSAEQLAVDRQTLAARLAELTQQWQAWLSSLQLPVDWQPELALTVLGRLQSLRDKLQQIPGLENRIAAMRQRLAEFDPFVKDLCQQVAPDWLQQPTELAARQLVDRLQAALSTDQRRGELTRDLHKQRTRLEEVGHQQRQLQIERQQLLELAGADTDEGFLQEAGRADEIRELDRQITASQRELTRLRDFEDESVFTRQLEAVDYPVLEAARLDLERQIRECEEQERQANERKGAAGLALDQLDGSAAAAEIQSTIAQRRAALAGAVDRYVPLILARRLLEQSLERFQRESQPAMLGEVSRLFEAMTGGRYHRVERPRDPSRPLIVYRADTRDDLEPSQLSTGTREQLYLAIRLAYVLHYCTKAEPLPIVLDDVLANFDPSRTRRTLEALGQITDRVQVLLFTCHPHVVALARDVFPELCPVEVPNSHAENVLSSV